MMKCGMANMMKQAHQMQANSQKSQSELANVHMEGIASNGLVKGTRACNQVVKRVAIAYSGSDGKATFAPFVVMAFKDTHAQPEATTTAPMGSAPPAGLRMRGSCAAAMWTAGKPGRRRAVSNRPLKTTCL